MRTEAPPQSGVDSDLRSLSLIKPIEPIVIYSLHLTKMLYNSTNIYYIIYYILYSITHKTVKNLIVSPVEEQLFGHTEWKPLFHRHGKFYQASKPNSSISRYGSLCEPIEGGGQNAFFLLAFPSALQSSWQFGVNIHRLFNG